MNNINPLFNEFALAFIGKIKADEDIIHPQKLDRLKLDGSVESLKELDKYLSYLNTNAESVFQMNIDITILRAGAYLGEVIRHNSNPGFYTWIDYNDYLQINPDLRKLIPERNTTTCAFLMDKNKGFIMPINKVFRFIDEGTEHSTLYFGSVSINKSTK
jgi:hypothetical protein